MTIVPGNAAALPDHAAWESAWLSDRPYQAVCIQPSAFRAETANGMRAHCVMPIALNAKDWSQARLMCVYKCSFQSSYIPWMDLVYC